MAYKSNIGILATKDNPFISKYLFHLYSLNFENIYVIYDNTPLYSSKNEGIFFSRYGKFTSEVKSLINSNFNYDRSILKNNFFCNHNSEETINVCIKNKIVCLLNAGTPRKLGKEIILATRLGIVNVHPGILPKYRGANCVEWSLLNKDKIGLTAHLMNEFYDSGPIIFIKKYNFDHEHDYKSIRQRILIDTSEVGVKALEKVLINNGKKNFFTLQKENEAQFWYPMPNKQFLKMKKQLSKKKSDKIHVQLKKLNIKDVSERYVSWFKNKKVMKYSLNQFQTITIESEKNYVRTKKQNALSHLFGIYFKSKHIGNALVEVIKPNYSASVSYLIGETDLWNKGIGTQCLKLVCKFAKQSIKIKVIFAGIAESNLNSKTILLKNNFFFHKFSKNFIVLNNKKENVLHYVKFL